MKFSPDALGPYRGEDIVQAVRRPLEVASFTDRHGDPATAVLGRVANQVLLILYVGVGYEARVFHVGKPTKGELRRLFGFPRVV